MTLQKGLFIVFEGIDGAGTTTQCRLLAEKTTAQGHPVTLTREPGGTPLAEAIRDLVLDPKATAIADLTELLLYAASRAQHVNERIKPSLARGEHVICDRFTASTWAYQGYGRGIDLHLIEKVTGIAEDGCRPDLTIFIVVPTGTAAERRAQRAQAADRVEAAGEEFLERVEKGYRKLAAKDTENAVTIDGSRNPSQVATEVWEVLQRRWPGFPSAPAGPVAHRGAR